ncbi:MAG: serine/threonine-protein kinase [Labilithrix sp.]
MAAGLPETGEMLEGKYRVERVVGEGAWGEVLEATNVRIKRRVAIKILRQQYASNPAMVQRFEREALASTHIESQHVVQIFDAGVLADGRPYMVMEFLVGEDLGKRIDKAPKNRIPLLESIGFTIQAARGLAAAHQANIFHRDMKPSNIVIAKTKTGREVAKIVDFGISKLLNDQEGMSNTQTGTIMGSPVYMSPEQARGSKNTDHRSDIYSLGVVLYECVTGRTPFVADSFNELLFKIALEEAPTPKSLRPDIDQELNDIIMKAIARDPDQRFQKAEDLEDALVGLMQKSGEIDISHWMKQSNGREDLNASPTRAKSLPEIIIASPVVGDSKIPTEPPPKVEEKTAGKESPGKETGTSLSKTQDPLEQAPKPSNNRKLIYAAAAAAVVIVGIIGVSSMKGNETAKTDPTAKVDTKPATSGASTETAAPPPTAPPATNTGDSATPTATADAGATATTATTPKPVFVNNPRPQPVAQPTPAPGPAPAQQPSTKPASSTMVNGRPITTALPF